MRSWAEAEQVFGGRWAESGLGDALHDFFLNGGHRALVVRLPGGATPSLLDAGGLPLVAADPGTWGNDLTVEVRHPDDGEAANAAARLGVKPEDLFHLLVRRSGPAGDGRLEQFLDLTVADGPRRADGLLATSLLVRVAGALRSMRPAAGVHVVTTRGSDGSTLAASDYDDGVTSASRQRGLHALRRADLFNVVCLPPPDPSGSVPDGVWALAARLCEERRAFLLVDPPPTVTATGVEAWLAGLGIGGPAARNAALYFPRIRRPDPWAGGTPVDRVPCGAVAGIMARTDEQRGVWRAPAGRDTTLTGVPGLSVPVTDADQQRLNPAAVNCLRTLPDVGTVVWGARTLRGADALGDEYKYVPVRRLALFIEESLHRGTQWAVFEPNGDPLWAELRAAVGSFMDDLFRRGAFQGRTPDEAYLVRCDAGTTPAADRARNRVTVLVGFAPLVPGEFLLLRVQQATAA